MAVASKDRLKLRAALDAAEDLDMQIAVMVKAREILKDLEAVNRQASGGNNSSAPAAPQPYDAAEEARKMRQEIAKQARFDIKNFPNLRTADDFARGAILNKSKIKETFLCFQANVIPKSLTDLNKDSNKLALQIHKDLLGYMGDKQLPFPAMLAEDISSALSGGDIGLQGETPHSRHFLPCGRQRHHGEPSLHSRFECG